jgi:pyridinium-3,5-biscarboxylic acid mononucleotide sulfurtransferase
MDFSAKRERLLATITEKGSMLISFSGGVDSGLLAVLAKEALKDKCRCVLLDSPVVPREAIAEAQEIAKEFGLLLDIIPLHIMSNVKFRENPAERCYWCKKSSAAVLKWRADELGCACIADGVNISDMGEHRPGLAASSEAGIVHPFIEAGLTKEDIRAIAHDMNLKFWDKPSAACLSSRIPYGDEITHEKLNLVEGAEAFLHQKGFSQVRVRIHGRVARIELPKEDHTRVLAVQDAVVTAFKSMGFSYITLDLEGYRSGSMDEVL